MLARGLELIGGTLAALGLCLAYFVRLPTHAELLPDVFASTETAICIAIVGGVLIAASKLVTRFDPD